MLLTKRDYDIVSHFGGSGNETAMLKLSNPNTGQVQFTLGHPDNDVLAKDGGWPDDESFYYVKFQFPPKVLSDNRALN